MYSNITLHIIRNEKDFFFFLYLTILLNIYVAHIFFLSIFKFSRFLQLTWCSLHLSECLFSGSLSQFCHNRKVAHLDQLYVQPRCLPCFDHLGEPVKVIC